MSRADELAYVSATELAERIRRASSRRSRSSRRAIERIEARNPSLNAFVFKGYDDARSGGEGGREGGHVRGEELGLLHGVPTAMKDLFDFKPGWKSAPSAASAR